MFEYKITRLFLSSREISKQQVVFSIVGSIWNLTDILMSACQISKRRNIWKWLQ